MTSFGIPNRQACMDLLYRFETPSHIIAHSVQVWRVGKLLGAGLMRNGVSLNIDLLRAACLLHDIAKYPCIKSGGGYHDAVGREMLEKEGLPTVGRIISQHVVIRESHDDLIHEEHILNYSDKRVVHDNIVSLDERFVYLEETYGKHPKAKEALKGLKTQTKALEDRIFERLQFEPHDVESLIEKDSN